jgi:adenosylcobyric acid synthase
LLAPFTAAQTSQTSQTAAPFDYAQFKQQQYDRLADHIRRHVDIDRIYKILSQQ